MGLEKELGANKSEAISIQELDEAIDIKTDEEASLEEKNIMKGIVKFGSYFRKTDHAEPAGSQWH